MRKLLAALTIALITQCGVFAQIPEGEAPGAAAKVEAAHKLAEVKIIFVAPLGSGVGSNLIREKIIHRLIKSGAVEITDNEAKADAILRGDAGVSKRHSFTINNGFANYHTSYSATGVVRLMDKDGSVLWTEETRSHNPFGSASSHVADKVADRLVKAIDADKTTTLANGANGL